MPNELQDNKHQPLVSIIVLNWNGIRYIKNCLISIIRQTYANIEIIIVDNNSTDNSLDVAKEVIPNCVYVLNKVNYGYAKGMNIGISKCTGEYVLILNNDVYLHEDYIKKCILFLLNNERAGCCAGSEFLWCNGEKTSIQVSKGPLFLKRRIQLKEYKTGDTIQQGFGVSGSFAIYRSAAIMDLISISGYFFDESFETGWEDTDVRFRLFYRGWETYYLPEAVAWHAGSGSAGEKKTLVSKKMDYQIRIFRNRRFVINKNLTTYHINWKRFLSILEIFVFFYYLILRPKSAVALILGNIKAFKLKDETRRKGEVIQSNIVVDPLSIKKFIR